MTGLTSSLDLMLAWALTNKHIQGYTVHDRHVSIVMAHDVYELDHHDAHALMKSLVCQATRSQRCLSSIVAGASGRELAGASNERREGGWPSSTTYTA